MTHYTHPIFDNSNAHAQNTLLTANQTLHTKHAQNKLYNKHSTLRMHKTLFTAHAPNILQTKHTALEPNTLADCTPKIKWQKTY